MVKIFLDSADIKEMELAEADVRGFTTNPTLMRKADVPDYAYWAKEVCKRFPTYPVSFEVISDDFDEMETQAKTLSSFGENVYVKVPVTNTRAESCGRLIKRLHNEGIKVNVTAVFTKKQVRTMVNMLQGETPSIISIFAGRIADTGIDPTILVAYANEISRPFRGIEILWASTRQVLDVHFPAGADIITVSKDILAKMSFKGKDLDDYSRETVKQFYDDARKAGYTL